MSRRDEKTVTFPHEDIDSFRDAVQFTSARSGFPGDLIEKDYFCSLVLSHLFGGSNHGTLVFKGGTSLNKIHFGFYRLSEDLDFSIPVALDATRGDRRKAKSDTEKRITELQAALPFFAFTKPWTGANNSTQYLAEVAYPSVITNAPGRIKIEAGLREPMLMPPITHGASCLVLDPGSEQPVLDPVNVRVMDLREAMAEKARATLARLTPAIRDVFDLWHARQKGALPFENPEFITLVRQKLAIPGNAAGSASTERRDQLRGQVNTELRPVLRSADFDQFNFDEAWKIVEELARLVFAE
ncbi:MAG: hypothetical protein A2583_12700 [Bdellovibrionales bacterium RIFOXYD1_FULL_53_11]|nr:MAG: hypothetical protein A2583_12700 [Bdellovibrionales bacterium RIFOXYD1_FULL_53_11]